MSDVSEFVRHVMSVDYAGAPIPVLLTTFFFLFFYQDGYAKNFQFPRKVT